MEFPDDLRTDDLQVVSAEVIASVEQAEKKPVPPAAEAVAGRVRRESGFLYVSVRQRCLPNPFVRGRLGHSPCPMRQVRWKRGSTITKATRNGYRSAVAKPRG